MAISQVRVGDFILAADNSLGLVLSPVIAVPHPPNSVSTEFVRLETNTHRTLLVTPHHLLLSTGSCFLENTTARDYLMRELIQAGSITTDHCVFTAEGLERVLSIEKVQGRGVYTVVTEAPFILVNGIITSPFEYNHILGSRIHSFFHFVRTHIISLWLLSWYDLF